MRLFHLADLRSAPSDPETFSGEARVTPMPAVAVDPAVNAYRVAFEPQARTAWHLHSGPQLLVVLSGRCRVQREGEPMQLALAGDVVSIAAGERHWHGADRDGPMVHLAFNVDAATTWFGKVSDTEYEVDPWPPDRKRREAGVSPRSGC